MISSPTPKTWIPDWVCCSKISAQSSRSSCRAKWTSSRNCLAKRSDYTPYSVSQYGFAPLRCLRMHSIHGARHRSRCPLCFPSPSFSPGGFAWVKPVTQDQLSFTFTVPTSQDLATKHHFWMGTPLPHGVFRKPTLPFLVRRPSCDPPISERKKTTRNHGKLHGVIRAQPEGAASLGEQPLGLPS